ncbi:MAG: GNAT family N-acetyltransferase [Rothia sp. (in: high G+C Gram-positive bacteria)]|uniref:GNAT family N-acetyltransferase n=1 Tax=Rothia sp. (in: high G+C Gram-positive bacteria) TaxID=1885016 RepID=UPI0026E0F16E|nr:GNAT family N-acetyltransferase [Rothia sp. (in: high G+C Gram-positive bacteria)]MDO5750381.1 GNAT family N-acetyltransferase [Rothia sp. (in: high G+C Gram-positive bacteria)]
MALKDWMQRLSNSSRAASSRTYPQLRAVDEYLSDQLEWMLYADMAGNLYTIDQYERRGLPERAPRLSPSYQGFVAVIDLNDSGQEYVRSAMLMGVNSLPIRCEEADRQAFARLLLESSQLRALFGPSEEVLPLWDAMNELYRERTGENIKPFSPRPNQPLLYLAPETSLEELLSIQRLNSALAALPAELPKIQFWRNPAGEKRDSNTQESMSPARWAQASDSHVLVPAAAAMYSEELGYNPLDRYGSAYVESVQRLIEEQRSVIISDTSGRVIFKTDAGISSDSMAQIQGVWLHPDYRGRGLSTLLFAHTCALLRTRWEHITLYVNDYNAPALALYERTGWEDIGSLSTFIIRV